MRTNRFPQCAMRAALAAFGLGLAIPCAARADQLACTSDGNGTDQCQITFPNVLAGQTAYPDLIFRKGDTVEVSASGCAQTGGHGATWKRYLNPAGDNADHLYHGLIAIPGSTQGLVRIQSVAGAVLPASSGGMLSLGYEDDDFSDNGYWSHDDGNDNQCQDQSGPNNGRAVVFLTIHHHDGQKLEKGTRYGMCHKTGAATETCHIDRPDVTHATEAYPAISFRPGDNVVVTAGGCVQTGGSGATWKRYVEPLGPNADRLYHGLVSIPGTTSGLVRIATVFDRPLPVFKSGSLTLGYEDDDFGDNGYWSHDDGTGGQCQNVGPAFLAIAIDHQGPHVSLDAMEVTQAIQDIANGVTLVAGKETWVRAYLTGVDTDAVVTGTLTARQGTSTVTVAPAASLTLISGPSALRPRRERWNGSLNFKLPASVTGHGAVSLSLSVREVATGHSMACNACTQTVAFVGTPPLRVHIVALSYTTGSGAAAITSTPSATDLALFESWIRRAYPVASVEQQVVTVASTNPWPFTCDEANAQISALRGSNISAGEDARTHYIALVSNAQGFMRGCASGVPSSPDPSTVASSPAGPTSSGSVPVNVTGDTDGSFGDWYGGHELGHTFGRAHPGFCNGNSRDDTSFPYPNGQISDDAGDDTGLDVGDHAQAEPLIVLPGAARFDIMTYCNQPQWLSAYTYTGVRDRLAAENGSSGGGGAPGGAEAGAAPRTAMRAIPGSFVHVVATVNLKRQTARIRFVNPARAALPDITSAEHAEIRLLTAQGQTLQIVSAALREDTDTPAGEDHTALIDAYIPNLAALARIQIVIGGKVADEFRASAEPPAAPKTPALARRADRAFDLRWTPAAEHRPGETYTIEASTDGKHWTTIGIGLTSPEAAITEAQAASPFIRVIATNGLRSSAPAMIRGTGQPR